MGIYEANKITREDYEWLSDGLIQLLRKQLDDEQNKVWSSEFRMIGVPEIYQQLQIIIQTKGEDETDPFVRDIGWWCTYFDHDKSQENSGLMKLGQ